MRMTICRASGAFAVAVVLALGVMAQASAAEVRPFEEIAASDVTITPDPSGRSVVLEVNTSIDVACSVVYGTDETFGLIAVDSDMDGGAHADHHPVVGGLQPDTDYVYRLQGTAADGTIYVSEVMAFRTPAAPVGGPANLALDAAVIGVSSEWSEAFAAEFAFDGDRTTEWSSRGDADEAWVEIDLGAPRSVASVVFHTRAMSDGSSITQTFGITADGTDLGSFPADDPARIDREARILRFDVISSSGGNTGAVEIEVLAAE